MADVVSMSRYIKDSFTNLVSMLGTTRDKAYYNQFAFNPLDRGQLDAAFRGDWVARKIVTVPAQDATRAWRNWQAADDQIQKIEDVERKHGIQSKLKSALIRARLYGGAGLLMGFGDADPSKELNVEVLTTDSLKYIHVFSAFELNCGPIIRDVSSPDFGKPEYYEVGGGGAVARVHTSRIVRLSGAEVPDRSLSVNGWDDSVLQAVYDAVMNVSSSTAGIATLIQENKIDIVKIPDFMKNMADPSYKQLIIERFALANQAKSMVNTLLMDKEEEWERINASFAGMPDLMKLYLLIACGAADIPATRFLGQAASGLNASGDNELRNYYDSISSQQVNTLTPALTVLDEAIIRSALGSRPKEVHYEWAPLWQLDETQKAALGKTKAETTKLYVDAGIVEPAILAPAVLNQLTEDGSYPGIEQAIDDFEKNGGGVDETDPNVQEQFAQLKSAAANAQSDPNKVDPNAQAKKSVVDPKTKKPVKDSALFDSEPRPLYVRRDLLNAKEVRAHYAKQLPPGWDDMLYPEAQMHVTIVYSKSPVDWIAVGEDYPCNDDGTMTVAAGGPRFQERFGPNNTKDTVVLQFSSSRLSWRHEEMVRKGCSMDYPEYQPHVSLIKDPQGEVDIEALEPWRGQLEFGPEIFEGARL